MQIKENKKLIVSLLISFIVIASFTGIMGYVSASITKDSINQLVGRQSTFAAFSALNKIDTSIADKISELKKLGKESTIQNALTLSNRSEQVSENRIVSNKLDEKIALDNGESDYIIYENIILRNLDGNIIASSGDIGNKFFEDMSLDETRELGIFLGDVYHDDELDEQVYGIGILISDSRGQTVGSIHALVNFKEIIALIEDSREESQFVSSEFDLFYDDGFLLYSTTDRQEEYSISDFASSLGKVYQDIEKEFEILDKQYDITLKEFGYVEPKLSEEQWKEIKKRFLPLDEQYEKILDEYELGELSENRQRQLEAQMQELDLQYDMILREYGFAIPFLSEAEQLEFDERIMGIDIKHEEIYKKYDNLDFTFGEKGFSIVESDSEKEILQSYSRQRGYQNFEGFDWILIVHTEMDEILQDVNSQRDLLLFITVTMTVAATVLGVLFSRVFYKQSQKISKNEKMSTIGQLSSNIAHDMRNPLGTIRSSTERISDQNKDQNQTISDEVKRINRSVKRMSHQVEGVLNYVRTTPLITDECSVLEMLKYAKNSIDVPNNVKIILPENDMTIECDQEKIEITFVNLILNAIQAIGKTDDGTVKIRMKEEKQNILISFKNDGPSISDEVLPKIFEPLFTTRLKGTGLGLSSCKNIIEQHHGKIIVTQSPATFTIQIPKRQ